MFRAIWHYATKEVPSISLPTIALAFVSGLLSAELFSFFPFLTGLSLLLFLRFYKNKIALFIVCGIGFVFPHLSALLNETKDLDNLIGQGQVKIVARVNKPPLHGPDRVTLHMKAESVHSTFRVNIGKPETAIVYGDLLEMDIKLHAPRQFGNPGAFQSADYLKRQGLSGTTFLPDEQRIKKIGEGGNRFLKEIYRYRNEIRKKILADISSPTGPILLAMVLGESYYLDDSIRDAFTDSGTNHILSISGSHLAMVAFFVFGFSRFLLLRLPAPILLRISLIKIPSQWAALPTAIVVTLYTLLSGSQVATLRSLAMILAYLLALWIARSVNALHAISLAAILILIVQPQAIFDISFQLSFLAISFIVLVSQWWDKAYPKEESVVGIYNKIKQAILLLLISSVGATLGTMPLTLYYFHQFSWVGFAANFIVIPYTGFVFLPLGFISSLASPFLSHFPLSGLNEAIGAFYFKMTDFFASLPGAALHFASPHLLLILLFYLILLALLISQASLRRIACTVAFFSVLFLGVGAFRLKVVNPQITFIDVGQGDSALIEFPGGKTLLVDAGSSWPINAGKSAVTPYLWERKIRTIDYLVGTHPQMDHIGGFVSVMKKFEVKNILTNGINRPSLFYQEYLKAVDEENVTPQIITKDSTPIESGGCKVVFLNPIETTDPAGKDLNNHSIVFRLSCPGGSFLFTGDIEKKAMRRLMEEELQSDILKVPHHGSKGSLYYPFIDRVSPTIAVFSVGERNRYKHPRAEVVGAYEKLGAKIYRTDQDGAITVTLHNGGPASAGSFSVKSFREGKMKKVVFDRPILEQEIENMKKWFLEAKQ